MHKLISPRAILFALALGAAPAAAEAPAKPALAWSVPVEADEGFKLGFTLNLALHADGTALLAIDAARGEGSDEITRLLLLSAAEGRVLHRSSPHPDAKYYVRGAYLAAAPDGFALLTNRGEPEALVVYRLARDGRVRAAHPVRVRGEPIQEIGGVAADGRGNLLVLGGGFEGPHSPAMALLDPTGRILWSFVGKHPMPPGGVPAARFRRDGGIDAVVIDREKPSWERRSAKGALLTRAPLSPHWNCWSFLDDRALATVFFNWAEKPSPLKAPTKRWLLGLAGADGRFRPNHVALELPGDESAHCRLAVHEAGWVAVSLKAPKVLLFDAALKLRAEIDVASRGIAEIGALAVDAKGAVTVLGDTEAPERKDRKMLLLRYAPPAP